MNPIQIEAQMMTTVEALLKGMAQFRVLNTSLYQGFRADLADRAEAEFR